jgi:hypothetical protein
MGDSHWEFKSFEMNVVTFGAPTSISLLWPYTAARDERDLKEALVNFSQEIL